MQTQLSTFKYFPKKGMRKMEKSDKFQETQNISLGDELDCHKCLSTVTKIMAKATTSAMANLNYSTRVRETYAPSRLWSTVPPCYPCATQQMTTPAQFSTTFC